MKLFRTSSTEVVKQCQEYFAFEIPSVLWAKRVNKFKNKLKNTDNLFYNKSSATAEDGRPYESS